MTCIMGKSGIGKSTLLSIHIHYYIYKHLLNEFHQGRSYRH